MNEMKDEILETTEAAINEELTDAPQAVLFLF